MYACSSTCERAAASFEPWKIRFDFADFRTVTFIALLPMSECITVMEGALRNVNELDQEAVLPLRTVMRLDGTPNAFAAMPAVVGKGAGASLGAKIITVFPGNDATPYDAHIGVVLLFDAEHGTLLADRRPRRRSRRSARPRCRVSRPGCWRARMRKNSRCSARAYSR